MNKTKALTLIFVITTIVSGCSLFHKKVKPTNPGVEKVAETSLLIDAVKDKNIGNFESAITKLNKLIEKNPKSEVAYYQLSLVYKAMENFNAALENGEKAYELAPQNEWILLNLTEIYEATKQYPLASKLREELIIRNPQNTDYYYDLVVDYIYSNKWEEGINTYNKVEKQIGITEEISMAKHRIWNHLKKPENAAAEIQKLIDAFPAENRYPLILGDYYLKNNQFDKAKAQFNKALALDNKATFMSLAEYYKLTKNNDSSFFCLKKAFAEPEVNIDLKMPVLLSYYDLIQKNPSMMKDANSLLDSMAIAHSDNPKYWSVKADFALLDNQPKKAKQAFIEVLKYDQSKYVIWEELLKIWANEEQFDSVIIYSNKAIELFPSQPFLFYVRGVASYMKADYNNAIQSLEMGKGLVLEPNGMYLEMFIYLGESYHKLNNNDRSDAAFEKVLEMDPKNSYVLNNYSYYLSLRNAKLDKAEKMAKKLTDLYPSEANYQDTYAWVLFKLQKYAEALPIIEKSITLGGDKKADVMEHYGDILWKSGNTERAVEAWEKALILNPHSGEILRKKVFFKGYVE
jgi:tetratricopeptide (TPR) repeat protein